MFSDSLTGYHTWLQAQKPAAGVADRSQPKSKEQKEKPSPDRNPGEDRIPRVFFKDLAEEYKQFKESKTTRGSVPTKTPPPAKMPITEKPVEVEQPKASPRTDLKKPVVEEKKKEEEKSREKTRKQSFPSISLAPPPQPSPPTTAGKAINASPDFDDTFLLRSDTCMKIDQCLKTNIANEFLKQVRRLFGDKIPTANLQNFWTFAMQRLAVQSLLVNAHELNVKLHKKFIISDQDLRLSQKGKKPFYSRLFNPAAHVEISDDSKWDDIVHDLFSHEGKTSWTGQKTSNLVQQAAALERYPEPEAILSLARGFRDAEIELFGDAPKKDKSLSVPPFLILGNTDKKWEDYLENEAAFLSNPPSTSASL